MDQLRCSTIFNFFKIVLRSTILWNQIGTLALNENEMIRPYHKDVASFPIIFCYCSLFVGSNWVMVIYETQTIDLQF